jgi:NIMA (never in mitosis gene a)-related kinase
MAKRNIFLDKNNVIKLGDLGLAKLMESTKASTFAGSPAYMSPEQFRCLSEHGTYSTPTDIWFYDYYESLKPIILLFTCLDY